MGNISVEKIRTVMRKMKKREAQCPDDIQVEAWIALGLGLKVCTGWFVANLFNRLLLGEKMPNEWRRSAHVPIYKGKEDVEECGNYRGNKLMSRNKLMSLGLGMRRVESEYSAAY